MDATLPEVGANPYREVRHLLPKLAQPWWYQLVGHMHHDEQQAALKDLSRAGQKVARRKARRAVKRAAALKASRRTELAEKLGPLYILTA